MQLFDRIKKLRKSLKISQLVFSKALGVSRGHISKIETGTAEPSEQLINLICATWGIDKQWLLKGEGRLKIKYKNNITSQESEDILIEEGDRIRYDALINNLKLLSNFIKNYANFFDSFALSYEANFDTLMDPEYYRNIQVAKGVSEIENEIEKLMRMIKKLTTVPADDDDVE